MTGDHRRILATGIARLRAKIKYRPVVFELMAPEFTLLQLQRSVEALAGRLLHKQNFRRLIEQQELVEETGAMATATGGRPAKLYRFRRGVLAEREVTGDPSCHWPVGDTVRSPPGAPTTVTKTFDVGAPAKYGERRNIRSAAMSIEVGGKIPDATFTVMTEDGPAPRTSTEIFSGRKVVLIARARRLHPDLLDESPSALHRRARPVQGQGHRRGAGDRRQRRLCHERLGQAHRRRGQGDLSGRRQRPFSPKPWG